MQEEIRSPNWSDSTKMFVAVLVTIIIALAIWRFQTLISPLVGAGIVAYLLNPVIIRLTKYTPLSRGAAIGLVYLLFALIVVAILTVVGVTSFQQMSSLVDVWQEVLREGPDRFEAFMNQSFTVGPWTFQLNQFDVDLSTIGEQLAAAVQIAFRQSAQFVTAAASTTATWVTTAVLIFVFSIYFTIDFPRFGNLITDAFHHPGYRNDARRLLAETGRIWNGYLRGQITLAIVMSIIFTVTLWILGVRYALALGILAGVLDFIPFVGAILTSVLSTGVAIFQGENWLGLNPIWFGLIVLVVGIIIQQIEGNILQPKIVGGALGIHPLLIMVGTIMGGILGGLLGVVLAAPVIATIKLLGAYGWRKMLDLDPFPESAEAPEPSSAVETAPQPHPKPESKSVSDVAESKSMPAVETEPKTKAE